jgi:hypothetical protein
LILKKKGYGYEVENNMSTFEVTGWFKASSHLALPSKQEMSAEHKYNTAIFLLTKSNQDRYLSVSTQSLDQSEQAIAF